MKNILVIVTFLLSVVLTGCGSNSKPDGGPNPALDEVLELQAQEILLAPNGTDFSLTMPLRKLIDETYHVELSGYTLEVDGGCMVSSSFDYDPSTKLEFDGVKNSQEMLYISGAFDANCTPTGYTLRATQKVTSGNLGDTRQVSFSYEYGSGSVKEGYSFYNATTPLTISETSTPYQIKVQLLKDGRIAEGETIELAPIGGNNNGVYGEVADYSVVTGADGYGTFAYTSPETLPPSGSSKTLQVNYYVDGNISKAIPSKEIVLNFIAASEPEVNTTDMQLWVVPGEFNITEGSQTRAIDLYLGEISTDSPLEEIAIKAELFDPNYGVLNSYNGITDVNGHVTLDYTAPEKLPNSPLNITFKVLQGQPDLSVSTHVNFIGGQTIDTTNMDLHVTLDTIDANSLVPELTEDIDIWLSDDSNNTIEGVEVRALFFDPDYGHLDKYTGETDETGHIVFTYTGPEANPGNDINIIFEIVNGSPTKTVDVLLDF